ncbi:Ppx/GppA phosphatase family protein [Streptomyces zagrosensis]|uniref:Exopolyphosphatase/guanosine-5'-triphosphate, 3'-diphosphate pyrophosphatase n=1 Tax=Streptomyces zagrosensis TaxID=1042984 RepID=A0A7W9QF62_9ACTN|nr:Ppx/GppA phosphatase family protein [Streptomyces zagrosensis]MBB5939161.1 exopolyphosphatase/guanosine-5'-triphosphate,3'-diphosphate pyrophosphatase [Streptomyces zagrosensis]
MKRVAAIDCGTNSIRLLVADIDPATGELHELDRRMTIVRLGQDVDRTGRLAPDALERTFAACREYAKAIKDLGVPGGDRPALRFVATSASRDASNREDFVRGVREILGVEPEVITGDEEAALSFAGATRELTAHEGHGSGVPASAGEQDSGGPDTGLGAPYLVVDIGGGSTEFVVGDREVHAARSVNIGCVRMTERHFTDASGRVPEPGTPTAGQIAAIRADVESALDEVEQTVPLRPADGGDYTLVGLAGSVTTVAAIALGLSAYDSAAIHHSRVSFDEVREITDRLLHSTHAERAAIPVMHPGRVDVIGAGALVLRTLMERAGAREVVVSEHDILDGIAFAVAERAGA